MSDFLKKIFSKKFAYIFFIDIFPHIVVCTILSIFDYSQAIAIFLIGLILPDFLTGYVKLSNQKGAYFRRKKYLDALHGITLIIATVALFYGYPLVGLAGIIHVILDYFGL
jgi:hypothetical protein